MNRIKNLIFSAVLLVNFGSTIFAMLKNNEITLEKKENQKFTAFSEYLESYNIDQKTINEFCVHPFYKFKKSTPYVCCQPSFTTTFFNFAQKALLGSSAQDLKNAFYASLLIKYNTNHTFDDIIEETPFLENKISDEMRQKQLRIPKNVNIKVKEKNLYTERDILSRDLPDKISFTIDGYSIHYTIEMDSTTNQQNPGQIFSRFAKVCALIESNILIKRPLRNFFINTLGYAGLLLPYCKEVLPYCKDSNNSSLAAAGLFTTVLVADCCKIYFESRDEKAYKSRAQELSGQMPVDHKYEWFQQFDKLKGKVNGRSYILTIAAISQIDNNHK